MNTPSIQQLPNFKLQSYSYIVPELDLGELPKPQLTLPSRDEIPQLSPILTTFFTVMYRAVLADKLSFFAQNIDYIFDYAFSKFDFEKTLLMRKYSQELEALLSSYGYTGDKIPSGDLLRTINELQIREMVDLKQAFAKYIIEHYDLVKSFIDAFIKADESANSLYRDIFESDFKITYEIHQEIVNALYERYQESLNDFYAKIDEYNLRLAVFDELVKREKIKLERISELIEEAELEGELNSLFNEYNRLYNDYLIELERYRLLSYEQYSLDAKVYQEQLKKFASEIKLVNSVSDYIIKRVRAYLSKANIAEEKLRINEEKLNIANKKVSIEEQKFRAFFEENNASLEEISAKIDAYAMDLRNYEERIKLAIAQAKSELSSYKVDALQKIISLLEQKEDITTAVYDARAKIRKFLIDYDTSLYSLRAQIDAQNRSMDGYLDRNRILLRAASDYNRGSAMACSSVSASIIRTFAEG